MFHGSGLPDDGNYHLSRELQFPFNPTGYIVTHLLGGGVVNLLGVYYDPYLPACLDGVGDPDSGKAGGNPLKFLQAFYVLLQGFPPGAWTAGRVGIGRAGQRPVGALHRYVLMVGGYGVDDL